jgi:hypothetical protein
MLAATAMAALAVTATVLAAGPATAAPSEKPSPTPANGSSDPGNGPLDCSSPAHSKNDPIANGLYFDGSNVNIRLGPHLSCNTILGEGQLNHTVDYHCWAFGDAVTRNGRTYTTWTHLHDVTTNKDGWVSDSLLDQNPPGNAADNRGSLVMC